MRTILALGLSVGLSGGMLAGPAKAQRVGAPRQGYPQASFPQRAMPQPGFPQGSIQQQRTTFQGAARGQRWGGQVGGRWVGGMQAPGGWQAYRRPSRGWTLPRYWVAPSFFIGNYASYGLSVPPQGYYWTRYYDDAVLVDRGGRVWDSVNGLDWDRDDDGGAYLDQRGYAEQRDYGDQRSYQPQPRYGAPYSAPTYGFQGTYQGTYTQPPAVVYDQPREVVQPTYQQGYSGGYAAGGSYAGTYSGTYVNGQWVSPPGVTTTITVQSAPVVTTTTTEYIEEVEYRAPVVRRVYRKPVRKWRPAPRQCGCR
ncbi:MAG: hypothetical protein B7Y45_09970 [Sphingomonas sp. 28-66-16]|nr:MAG: hypothetical protein B7Y45_09970 [Sphingomonas sp. 28-66-16]